MANKNRYTAQQVIDALKATKGMIYYAAERLGCHADTIKNYANRYASVAAELERQTELVNDLAELKLIQAINAGDLGAIKYRLSMKAKNRGYGDGPSGAEDDPLHIKVIEGPKDVR